MLGAVTCAVKAAAIAKTMAAALRVVAMPRVLTKPDGQKGATHVVVAVVAVDAGAIDPVTVRPAR